MPPTERRLKSISNIRQSIGQDPIPRARQRNNIWWLSLDVKAKIFPTLNVYPRLYPKSFRFRYFARFVNQSPQKRNLYELTHALPYRGEGCFLSRRTKGSDDILQLRGKGVKPLSVQESATLHDSKPHGNDGLYR